MRPLSRSTHAFLSVGDAIVPLKQCVQFGLNEIVTLAVSGDMVDGKLLTAVDKMTSSITCSASPPGADIVSISCDPSPSVPGWSPWCRRATHLQSGAANPASGTTDFWTLHSLSGLVTFTRFA